jgi:hypothetical protein
MGTILSRDELHSWPGGESVAVRGMTVPCDRPAGPATLQDAGICALASYLGGGGLGGEQRIDGVMQAFFCEQNARRIGDAVRAATGYAPAGEGLFDAMIDAFQTMRPNMPDPMEPYSGMTAPQLRERIAATNERALDRLIPETREAHRMHAGYTARGVGRRYFADDDFPDTVITDTVHVRDRYEMDYIEEGHDE